MSCRSHKQRVFRIVHQQHLRVMLLQNRQVAYTPQPMEWMYDIDTGGQLQPGLSQEWLLTNGTRAFRSATVVGCNTRRYHGLLCAATLPPVGRIIALSRIGEL